MARHLHLSVPSLRHMTLGSIKQQGILLLTLDKYLYVHVRLCVDIDDNLIRILEHKAPACRDDGSKDEVDKTKADRSKYRESKDYVCMCMCIFIYIHMHI